MGTEAADSAKDFHSQFSGEDQHLASEVSAAHAAASSAQAVVDNDKHKLQNEEKKIAELQKQIQNHETTYNTIQGELVGESDTLAHDNNELNMLTAEKAAIDSALKAASKAASASASASASSSASAAGSGSASTAAKHA